jgi:hypothetical protein
LCSCVEHRPRRLLLAIALTGIFTASAPAAWAPLAPASAAAQDTLWYQQCANGGTSMLNPYAQSGFAQGTSCPTSSGGNQYRGVWTVGTWPVPGHNLAHWEVDAPPNIRIAAANVPEMADQDGSYYWGQFFYWDSGNSGWLTNLNGSAGSWGWQNFSPSSYFGWELSCNASSQCGTTSAYFDVFDLQLKGYEYQTPSIIAGPVSGGNNLWYQGGKWVHGSLPIDIAASDPSGVCRALVSWDGQTVQDTGDRPSNDAYWDQCDPNHASDSQQVFFSGATINTTTAVPGSATGVPLVLMAHNASWNYSTNSVDWTSDSESINVDNLPVGLSLNGPTDVPVTAGTQYVTATATSGPSGVGSIMCSVDGSPSTAEQLSGAGSQTATAQVPVSGLGVHTVSCYATNRAVDGNGAATASPTQTWSLKIGEPVQIYAGFPKTTRDCHRVRERVRKRIKRVRRCGSRTRERQTERVRFGRRVTLSGWVVTADGTPLAHVPVTIMTAPDEESYSWQQIAVVTTSSEGGWSATLPPGPSRLIEAYYAGAATLEQSTSVPVRVLVPAKIRLIRIWPPRVAWGGTIRITGQLLGGYLPPGGALVRLRIGYGRSFTTYGVQEHVTGNGRFSTTYTFGLGDPSVYRSYWFQIASLPMGNYPWAPAASGKRFVLVGGHPATPKPPAHHRHKRRRHHRHRKR